MGSPSPSSVGCWSSGLLTGRPEGTRPSSRTCSCLSGTERKAEGSGGSARVSAGWTVRSGLSLVGHLHHPHLLPTLLGDLGDGLGRKSRRSSLYVPLSSETARLLSAAWGIWVSPGGPWPLRIPPPPAARRRRSITTFLVANEPGDWVWEAWQGTGSHSLAHAAYLSLRNRVVWSVQALGVAQGSNHRLPGTSPPTPFLLAGSRWGRGLGPGALILDCETAQCPGLKVD